MSIKCIYFVYCENVGFNHIEHDSSCRILYFHSGKKPDNFALDKYEDFIQFTHNGCKDALDFVIDTSPIDVKLNEGVSVDTARSLASKTLDKLSDDEKAYYDIQFIIINESDTDHFPIMGYKHHTKSAISWTKNR